MNATNMICIQKGIAKSLEKIDPLNIKDKAIFQNNLEWPKGTTLTVSFCTLKPSISFNNKFNKTHSPIVDPLQNTWKDASGEKIIDAIIDIVKKRIVPLVNDSITFKFDKTKAYPSTNNQNHITIDFNHSDGAWSFVGKDINTQRNSGVTGATMNLGWVDVPTVIHEFGHTLGLLHEHQNSKGGIQWNEDEVYKVIGEQQGWSKTEIYDNIIKQYQFCDGNNCVNGSSFDPCSIMMYWYPSGLTKNNSYNTQNLLLSATDVKYLAEKYNSGSNFDYKAWYNQIYPDADSYEKNISECQKGKVPNIKSSLYFNISLSKLLPILGISIILILGIIIIIIIVKKRKNH